ncbi:ADP-ribose pyrophosphatase YjhB, NUDIX family [Xaviernesmea oryzae]|nr:ADP-ribose pyrophosphatase YjhB, NUDIX family [Xaviernesmea oryzae]
MRAPFDVERLPAPGIETELVTGISGPHAARPGVDFPGVGCGLAILREGRLLMARRLKAPEAGHWTIVGGKVDHGEVSLEAARREAEEESGLSIGSVEFLCLSEQIIPADRQHWISLIYVTQDSTGEPWLTEPDKISDIGWFPLDGLPAPLSVFARDAVTALQVRSEPPASDLDTLRTLEEALHQPALRAAPKAVSKLLAADFIEIGSSGTVYGRDEIITALAEEAARGTYRAAQASDYRLIDLGAGLAQLVYRTTGSDPAQERPQCRWRSSIWAWIDGRWQMRFHQATVV